MNKVDLLKIKNISTSFKGNEEVNQTALDNHNIENPESKFQQKVFHKIKEDPRP